MVATANPTSSWTVFVLTPDGAVVVEEYARTRGQGRAEAAKRYNLTFISKRIVLVSNRNKARRHELYELVQAEVDACKARREARIAAEREADLDRWGRPILTGSAAWFADMAQATPPAVEDISFTSSLPRRNRAHWARARVDALED